MIERKREFGGQRIKMNWGVINFIVEEVMESLYVYVLVSVEPTLTW